MKLIDALHVTAAAAGTLLITLALLWPATVDAVDPAGAKIVEPTLTVDGWTVAMRSDKPSYAVGEKPTITLKCSNPTANAVEGDLQLAMTGESPASRMSRMSLPPTSLWQGNCAVSLKAGETREYVVPVDKAIPANLLLTVRLLHAKPQAATVNARVAVNAVAMSLGVIAPPKPAAPVAARPTPSAQQAAAVQTPLAQAAMPRR
ncbi:MAG: hypothetical protein LLG01_19840 [Planctomycetaceae bacterium]|nr:hypothetical protein [Planctomycetaceae bacterium]